MWHIHVDHQALLPRAWLNPQCQFPPKKKQNSNWLLDISISGFRSIIDQSIHGAILGELPRPPTSLSPIFPRVQDSPSLQEIQEIQEIPPSSPSLQDSKPSPTDAQPCHLPRHSLSRPFLPFTPSRLHQGTRTPTPTCMPVDVIMQQPRSKFCYE